MLDREFGPYRLEQRLGRGGMADVYLARDTRSGRQVALKLVEIRNDRDSREIYDAERRGAMLQEAFGAFDAHVPAVHEYGARDGHFYLDMEYVEGEDLAERIAHGPLAPAEAVRITREVCVFLERAHSFETSVDGVRVRGIIHGDLKPKNVRLRAGTDEVKILDFGIAKGLSLTRKLTRNDFGSPAYLSPERLDTGAVDGHADCWSVGVLLYEMLSGELPYRGDTNWQLERQILARAAPAPMPPFCPATLVRVVLKLLDPNPERRYPDAASARADLDAFTAGLETQANREWSARRGVDEDDVAATRRTRQTDVIDVEGTRRTATGRPAAGSDQNDTAAEMGNAVVSTTSAIDAELTTAELPLHVSPDLRPAASPAPATVASPRRRRAAALRRAVGMTVAIVMMVAFANEVRVWSAARGLRVDIATRPVSDTTEILDRYQELSRQSLLGIGLATVRAPLHERLVAQADSVIANYRQNAPGVREAQWKMAALWLTAALGIDPSDRHATSRLRYCEAHLLRIDAEAQRRKKTLAPGPFQDAITRFEEAARLDDRWPDPYLGLTRVYIYGLDDLDKAVTAFEEAQRRGFRPGVREQAQMADGYRARGERLMKDADTLEGLPQERELLERAQSDFRRAIELYQEAAGFGDAGTSLRLARKRLDEIENRLDQLDPPGLLERILRQVQKR